MAAKPIILITGANGQTGQELAIKSPGFSSFEFIALSKDELPIHDMALVRNAFEKYRPAYLVNCAAYTAVDKAETEKEIAYRVNAEAVAVLAEVSKEYHTRFIHLSTDYVFDG